MTTSSNLRALIAEDEPILAAALQQALQRLWPELQIVASVDKGQAMVEQTPKLNGRTSYSSISRCLAKTDSKQPRN